MSTPRILIVEDEALVAMDLQDDLEEEGYEVLGICPTAASAVERAIQTRPDVVLMDVRLRGEGDGVDAASAIEREIPEVRIIFVTGSREPATTARIEKDHPAAILYKPLASEVLRTTIATVTSS
jgi:DNA-binding NarL/FixJ family response regulator